MSSFFSGLGFSSDDDDDDDDTGNNEDKVVEVPGGALDGGADSKDEGVKVGVKEGSERDRDGSVHTPQALV